MAEEDDPNADPNASADPEKEPESDPANEPELDPEVEQRARKHGWVPKDEFRGPEERWVDAETFLERGQNIPAINRERMQKLEARNESLESTLKEFIREQRQKDKHQHERSVAQIRRDREKALDDGDTDTVKRLDNELEQAQKSAPPDPGPESQETPGWTPEFKATVEQFKEQNSDWYGTDALRTKEFADYHDFLLQQNPNMGDEERLEAARKAVFEKYPRQSNRRKSGGSPVEGSGSSQRKGSGKKKGYDDLPPEAKQAYDKFVTQQQVMKGEEYLREYYGDEYEG